jgi:hypothetical protein
MASQSIGDLEPEDKGARISIMARADAHGLIHYCRLIETIAKICLQTGGAPYIRKRQASPATSTAP